MKSLIQIARSAIAIPFAVVTALAMMAVVAIAGSKNVEAPEHADNRDDAAWPWEAVGGVFLRRAD